ncbi:MAG: hypothetical protein DSY81_06695 [Bacillota bacterium]|nr:MAG: hypothetical protein DSY92_04915 [Planctomycetota bacterium]RUA09376.1 MAG: hypothetical protein DSY81_06695 [Bacillota bacterium]
MFLTTTLILALSFPTHIDSVQLDGHDLDAWKRAVLPGAEEAWLTIPWHATLHEGLHAAGHEQKPLLLWLMNGHPLGCT